MTVVLTGETEFTELVENHRRELQVHCYRMLGSFDESEDLVQETFLRAWRARETFEGRSTMRAWLYRIATNACLDAIARRPKHRQTADGEVSWLQPYPDALLDEIPSAEAGPAATVESRETIELAFLVAIQHLPPKQRAVLILRDVLGWSAADTAELLELSVASANSALQRARGTLREHLPPRRADWAPSSEPTEQERSVLRRYIEANERIDMDALAALLRDDLRWSMPPEPGLYTGRDRILEEWTPVMVGPTAWGQWRLVPTRANRQPAIANYARRPGQTEFHAVCLDVLRIEGDHVVEVTTFPNELFPAFGFGPTLPA